MGVPKVAYHRSVVCIVLLRCDSQNATRWLAPVLSDVSGHVSTHAQNSLAMVQPGIRKDKLVNVAAQMYRGGF